MVGSKIKHAGGFWFRLLLIGAHLSKTFNCLFLLYSLKWPKICNSWKLRRPRRVLSLYTRNLERFLKDSQARHYWEKLQQTCISLQLKPSLSGRVWRLEYPELEINLHPARTPESTPPAEDNLVWRLRSLYATTSNYFLQMACWQRVVKVALSEQMAVRTQKILSSLLPTVAPFLYDAEQWAL